MIKITYDLKTADINLKNTTLEMVAKYFDKQHEQFTRDAILVHRKSVLEILIYLIMITNVQTGRLRGSWLPYMEKHGALTAGKSVMADTARVVDDKGGIELNEQAIQEGKSMGFFIDQLFDTTIGTNVEYAEDVNRSTGIVSRAQMEGNRIYNDNFENFFEASYRQGKIPEEDDPTIKDIKRP